MYITAHIHTYTDDLDVEPFRGKQQQKFYATLYVYVYIHVFNIHMFVYIYTHIYIHIHTLYVYIYICTY